MHRPQTQRHSLKHREMICYILMLPHRFTGLPTINCAQCCTPTYLREPFFLLKSVKYYPINFRTLIMHTHTHSATPSTATRCRTAALSSSVTHQPKAKRQRSDLYLRQHRQHASDKRAKETAEERACRLKKMRDYMRARRALEKTRTSHDTPHTPMFHQSDNPVPTTC